METNSDLRAQILDASVTLIEEKGLGALSMREVARRAGVSHQAPYHYFADRQAILAAIAGEGFRRLSAALEPAVASKRKPVARLELGGRAYVAFALSQPGYFRVMFRPELVALENYPDALASAQEAFARLESLVAGVVEAGVIEPSHAPGLVTVAWSFVHGLSSLVLDGPLSGATALDGGSAVIDAAFRAYRRLLSGA